MMNRAVGRKGDNWSLASTEVKNAWAWEHAYTTTQVFKRWFQQLYAQNSQAMWQLIAQHRVRKSFASGDSLKSVERSAQLLTMQVYCPLQYHSHIYT